MRTVAVVAILLATALSGCSGGGSSSSAAPSQDLSETHGSLVGLVTNDEALPIVEAEIGIKAAKASPIQIRILTNSEGRFRLENVPAGRQTVTASHPGYEEASTTVTVVPGEETTVRLVLVQKASTEYKVVPLSPFKGKYQCAWENFHSSGECDFEVRNTTQQNLPFTEDLHNHSFMIPAGWGGLLFQVKWDFGVQPAGIEGIRFQMESQEDHGGKFLKLEATQSPMRILINQGEVAPDATLGYPIPARGVPVWINILPLGSADGALCAYYPTCYGAGVAVELNYEIYATIFYGGRADETYSAIPD